MAIKAKGLHETYKKLVQAKKECTAKLEEVVLNHDFEESEVKDDSALSQVINKVTEAQTKVKKAVVHVTNQVFQLYSDFLLEEVK